MPKDDKEFERMMRMGTQISHVWMTVVSFGPEGKKIIERLTKEKEIGVNFFHVETDEQIENIPPKIRHRTTALIIIYEETENSRELTESLYGWFPVTRERGLIYKDKPPYYPIERKADFLIKAKDDEELYWGVKGLTYLFGVRHSVCLYYQMFHDQIEKIKHYEINILNNTVGNIRNGKINFKGVVLPGFYAQFGGLNAGLGCFNDLVSDPKGLPFVIVFGIFNEEVFNYNDVKVVIIARRVCERGNLKKLETPCPICGYITFSEVISEWGQHLFYICDSCAEELQLESQSGDHYKYKIINTESPDYGKIVEI